MYALPAQQLFSAAEASIKRVHKHHSATELQHASSAEPPALRKRGWNKARMEASRSKQLASLAAFKTDYATGLKLGRYVAASLPCLPFSDGQFQLVLSSFFLF